MKFDDKTIKDILLKENYVTEGDVKNAEDFAKTHHVSFIEYLLQENLITKDLLGQAIAESFEVPYADLNSTPLTPEQIQKIPEDIAKKYRAVIFSEEKDKIVIATDTPDDKNLLPGADETFCWKVAKRCLFAYGRHQC